HMTIDTIGCQPHLYNGLKGAGMQRSPVVTIHTTPGKYLHFSVFVGMRVMTGRTVQLIGSPETLTGRQQPILVTVDIQRSHIGGVIAGRRIIVQGIPDREAEGRQSLLPKTRMT